MTKSILIILLSMFVVVTSYAADTQKNSNDELDIKSDTMQMNFLKRRGVFENNVVVQDSVMKLTADKLTVEMDEKNEVKVIVATGKVVITHLETGGKYTGGKATYVVAREQAELTEKPEVYMGKHKLVDAETVIYDRKAGDFKTVGGKPHLVLIMEKDKEDFLDKDTTKDDNK